MWEKKVLSLDLELTNCKVTASVLEQLRTRLTLFECGDIQN